MKSIGEAIQYLHSINIAHRDVKVQLFIMPPGPPRLRCYRGPWGHSDPGKVARVALHPCSLVPPEGGIVWGAILCSGGPALSGQTPELSSEASVTMLALWSSESVLHSHTFDFSVPVAFGAGSLH